MHCAFRRDRPMNRTWRSAIHILPTHIRMCSQRKGLFMKTFVPTMMVAALFVALFTPGKAVAAGDTLVVYASTANLEQIITSDTTAAGLLKHAVYKLVSLDSTYVFQGPISVKSDITVIGVPDPVTGRPPCIQPMTLPDNSLPDFLFVLNGPQTKAVFKNLYLTGRSTDNTICTTNYNGAGALIQVAAEGIRLTVDNCVFSDWPTNNIGYSGDHTSIFVTNCKFRNGTISTAWYSGEAVRNTFNTAITDTLIMRYNTMFCMAYSAACPVTVNPCTYFEFNHNSVIYTFKNPFWIYNVTTGKVNNNLFYAAFAGASSTTEHFGMWDQLRSFALTGVVDFDTLNMPIAQWFDPADTAGSGGLRILWPAEAKRAIEVKNNDCYWPTAVTQFWTAWNDTAHVDSIVTPVWLNERTLGMFADKTHWPLLELSGNQEVNPQFGASIDEVLYNNTECGNGFFDHFAAVRRNDASVVTSYGYKMETVSGSNWIPTWPLPELADMHYTNTALQSGGTDGLPVGDPFWITGGPTAVKPTETVAHRFALSDAYPNPFNPSTVITASLPQAGPMSLKVYTMLGQLVQVVDQGYKQPGEYTYRVNLTHAASGVYFYTLQQGANTITRKMVLVR